MDWWRYTCVVHVGRAEDKLQCQTLVILQLRDNLRSGRHGNSASARRCQLAARKTRPGTSPDTTRTKVEQKADNRPSTRTTSNQNTSDFELKLLCYSVGWRGVVEARGALRQAAAPR
ncbi:unnamed protein product [Chrysodeixis includens]|uniref:Uncharacterized protein n=1 Tax=Chrysodeixis includens TaxID=689277 RepID=A0A9N8L6M9_CHRIL|nr:unnamed protein product [Chrysodeixis includens]